MPASMVKVRVTGLRETEKALRSLFPDSKARAILRRAMRKVAKPIQMDAQARAPVDPEGQQDLKLSIAVSGTLTKSQRADTAKKDPNDVAIYVGPSTKNTRAIIAYAHLQEFGSSIHGPHPYMRPAWDKATEGMVARIGQEIWKEIEKTSARAARKAAKAVRGF